MKITINVEVITTAVKRTTVRPTATTMKITITVVITTAVKHRTT